MDAISIARALHVLAIVFWIGGVAFVTLILLPALRTMDPQARLAMFKRLERRFGNLAKLAILVAGASGFYMTYELVAWDRFLDMRFWWMHAMVGLWILFSFMLFLAEPLFLHDWFDRYARGEPERSFNILQRMHYALLVASTATVAGAVLGAHGALP